MKAKIRKIVVQLDETHLEGGRPVAPATRRALAMAVIQNPYAGHDSDTLDVLIEIGEELGALLGQRCVQALGIADLIAVQLQRDSQGWFTGEIEGTPSMREGKVQRLQQWLDARGLSWTSVQTTFYSDSPNDLPLLSRVNHPVATNPDAALRAQAQQRGWPILELFATS